MIPYCWYTDSNYSYLQFLGAINMERGQILFRRDVLRFRASWLWLESKGLIAPFRVRTLSRRKSGTTCIEFQVRGKPGYSRLFIKYSTRSDSWIWVFW